MADLHVAHRVLAGAYRDSVVLMQLQRALAAFDGVEEAAAVMATPANREVLAEQGMLPAAAGAARPDDLLIVVRAASAAAAAAALGRVDELLLARREQGPQEGYRPRSLATALADHPEARWVLVSVPGQWAGRVARQALAAGRHVFLYSDNVPIAEEAEIKRDAARRGLLVMGPDCGTARVAGVGLGFANRVADGPVGLVAASGTGLQAVCCGLAARGVGVSQALGTGGRDLSAEIDGATAHAALDLLARDPQTRVVCLISKPPDPAVGARLLRAARRTGKPTVVWFLGAAPPARRIGDLWFATGSDEAAALAASLAAVAPEIGTTAASASPPGRPGGLLRGLFSGGTLASEAGTALATLLGPLAGNLHQAWCRPLPPGWHLPGGLAGRREYLLVDLGDDELTRGRPHPMIDPALLIEQLRAAAADPAVGALLLDVVLGDGAHPDPAGEIAPVIAAGLERSRVAGRELAAVVILVGSEADPQGRDDQAERLRAAGAQVFTSVAAAVEATIEALADDEEPAGATPVPLAGLRPPLAAINVGLELFAAALRAQEVPVAEVDWRPPAGGDERMAGLLDRIRAGGAAATGGNA